jgi:hypothetical protein
MSTSRWILSVGLIGLVACTTDIPTDTAGDPTSREIPPGGVIRGSVLYNGPHPCSKNGHIVGSALVLVFDRRNPPPPNGLATTAVNFVAVTGDLLFPNEPRWGGPNLYCPLDKGITDDVTVSAPFAISPLVAGSYVLESFYDYTGNFLPTFKFRNLPEMGDVGGGVIDTASALLPVNQNPNYLPHFLPVDVGTPQPLPKGSLPGLVPLYSMPSNGYVADNVNVTIGKVFTNSRPYFYASGVKVATAGLGIATTVTQESDQPATTNTGIEQSVDAKDCTSDPKKILTSDCANYAPILQIPQDIQVLGPPSTVNPVAAAAFESTYPRLLLRFGTAPSETATAKGSPFNMQLNPASTGGILVWQNQYFDPGDQLWHAQQVPEGNMNAPVPNLWPLVVLSKLVDDPGHKNDPASLQAQGDATHPVVVIQGITLFGGGTPLPAPMPGMPQTDPDSLLNTVQATGFPFSSQSKYIPCQPQSDMGGACTMNANNPGQPTVFTQDHLTVMVRPAVICFDTLFDPTNSDKRGNLVTPYTFGNSADMPPKTVPIVPLGLLQNDGKKVASVTNLVKPPPNYTAGTTSPAIQGCLPTGRYSINIVYPNGQAWTVPNEIGACTGQATGEGDTLWNNSPITCTIQDRSVLRSQGPRAVVEITPAMNPAHCQGASSMTNPGWVPKICCTPGEPGCQP